MAVARRLRVSRRLSNRGCAGRALRREVSATVPNFLTGLPRRTSARNLLTEPPYQTSLAHFPGEVRGEKFFGSLHIFLASKVNIRILHDANSLQRAVERERGLLMEDATKN